MVSCELLVVHGVSARIQGHRPFRRLRIAIDRSTGRRGQADDLTPSSETRNISKLISLHGDGLEGM